MTSNAETREHANRIEHIGLAIMEELRAEALLAFRFMSPALYGMPLHGVSLPSDALATDGAAFLFDPTEITREFRRNPNQALRSYLHLVLHCVFRHPFEAGRANHQAWDLACDIVAGATALELAGVRYPCPNDDDRVNTLQELRNYSPVLTAPRIYRTLADSAKTVRVNTLPDELICRLESLFTCDCHEPWPRCENTESKLKHVVASIERHEYVSTENTFEAEEDHASAISNSKKVVQTSQASASVKNSHDHSFSEAFTSEQFDETLIDGAGFEQSLPSDSLQWKDISRLVQAGLEAYRGRPSFDAETFAVNLNVANRKRCDYRQFLKRFACLSEEMKPSPDEFDYIYYTYGLKIYQNIPLVEPLEYQESTRVREFVIAIDTSASCAGELVRHFVEQTYNILKSIEGFGYKINVHIVQCDAEIRSIAKVTSIRDLDAYFTGFCARGFGGTDFRPVFRYIDDCIDAGEFQELKGMVYLTDGNGKYPAHIPEYETVFVFVEDNPALTGRVPPWASRVVMDEDEILEL